MSWSQSQYKLHRSSLGCKNFNTFQDFNDEDVEMIETQMQQHVEGSRGMSMRGEVEITTRKDDDIGKKKRGRAMTTKSKGAQNEEARVDEVELGDSEGEEENLNVL
jgi:hypothetical protein